MFLPYFLKVRNDLDILYKVSNLIGIMITGSKIGFQNAIFKNQNNLNNFGRGPLDDAIYQI